MAEHSKKYERVKYWYDNGFWGIARARNAVRMGWITPEEFKDITGYEYEVITDGLG